MPPKVDPTPKSTQCSSENREPTHARIPQKAVRIRAQSIAARTPSRRPSSLSQYTPTPDALNSNIPPASPEAKHREGADPRNFCWPEDRPTTSSVATGDGGRGSEVAARYLRSTRAPAASARLYHLSQCVRCISGNFHGRCPRATPRVSQIRSRPPRRLGWIRDPWFHW